MVICVPSAPLYSEPQLMAEQTDELLYGDEVEITGESGGFYNVRTDYGYEGWCVKQCVFEKLHDPAFQIAVPFADLLFEGRNYHHAPISLPMGARVDYGTGHDERYGFVVLPSKRIYFIHKNHVRRIEAPEKRDASALRDGMVSTALSYEGVQYRWGGRTHAGIDCSGLCFNACRFNGISIWRDADPEKTPSLKIIPPASVQKGDLLYFKGHMAIVINGGEFLHASASAGRVVRGRLDDKEFMSGLVCAGSVL